MKGIVKVVPIDSEYPICPGMWVIHHGQRFKLVPGTNERTAYLSSEGTHLSIPHPRKHFSWPVIEYSQDGQIKRAPIIPEHWDEALEQKEEVEFEIMPVHIGGSTHEFAEFERKAYPEVYVKDLQSKIQALEVIRKAYELIKDGRRFSESFVIDAVVIAIHEYHNHGLGGKSPLKWAQDWFKGWLGEASWNKEKEKDAKLCDEVHATLTEYAEVMMGKHKFSLDGFGTLDDRLRVSNLANKFKAYANTHGQIIQPEADKLQPKEENV